MGMQVNGQGHRWCGRVDVCIFVLHGFALKYCSCPLVNLDYQVFVYVAVVTTGCIHLPM